MKKQGGAFEFSQFQAIFPGEIQKRKGGYQNRERHTTETSCSNKEPHNEPPGRVSKEPKMQQSSSQMSPF